MILDDLAHSTGGTALSQNDFLGEFNRLANPPEYVYYLGFYPKDLKPDGKYPRDQGDAGERQGTVRAGAQGLLGAIPCGGRRRRRHAGNRRGRVLPR